MTTSTDQWVGVDAARPVSRDDEPTYKHLDEAIRELEHLRDSFGGITKEIRECEAGRPSSAVPWCLTHSQASSRCIGRGCDVATPPGHSDPTGDTALTRDRAREHRRDFLHALDAGASAAIRHARRASEIADLYPAQAERKALPPDPGGDWCRSCYRDHGYLEPVALRPGGGVRRAGYCRWCGEFKGAEGFDPTVQMVQARHRGSRITEGMVEQARKAHRATTAPRRKAKKGKKMKLAES